MSPFSPDSSLVSDVVVSPNQNERAGNRPANMLILHYTGMKSADDALARLCSPHAQVSSHYVVMEDGRIIQCVPEERRAWHAGESFWAGETDINSVSIGIEIANPGHDFGYPDYPRRQIAAVIALCRGIIARRVIPAERILAHSDVAPSRKKDPGEKFPWPLLHASGVGHLVEPAAIIEGPRVAYGDVGSAAEEIKSALSEYGYRITSDQKFDDVTRDAVTAFQRHFRPAKVDGVADPSTLMTARSLLAALPRHGARGWMTGPA